MPISTHILDTTLGRPAPGVPVSLSRFETGDWQPLNTAVTNPDGRCPDLHLEDPSPGLYRIHFDTAAYFQSIAVHGLYPFVEIAFEVRPGQHHYHIPLLLTANSYTTYRGS